MPIKFKHNNRQWSIREGFAPMGSVESQPTLLERLHDSSSRLKRFSDHQLASWIIARLCYITADKLLALGEVFSHDTDEFGYKVKISDSQQRTLAHGAIVFHRQRISCAAVEADGVNFQALLAELLVEWPDDLGKCEITFEDPDSREKRKYGWDGDRLLG
ncbi:hypothetical protein [Blastopirellula marina]|nr:hypothetical protein [Blastopirellula marina]